MGEFVGSMIYTIEGAHENFGFWGGACKGAAVFGHAAGLGVASLIRYVLDDDRLERWGWRLPFVIGAVLGLVGMLLRSRLLATLEQSTKAGARPLLEVLNTSSRESSPSHAKASSIPTASVAVVMAGASAPPLSHASWLSVQTEEDEGDHLEGASGVSNTQPTLPSPTKLIKGDPLFACSKMFLEISVCIGFIAFWCLTYYTIFVWQLYFLTTEELIGEDEVVDKRDAWIIVFMSNMAMPFLLPLGGYIGDIVGSMHASYTINDVNMGTLQQQIRYRTWGSVQTMKVAAILMFLVAVPAYKFIITPRG